MPGDVDWDRLSKCQDDAAAGLYAQAITGFIRWLAPHYGDVRRSLRDEITALRQAATQSAQHRRTPDIVAQLAVGWHSFLTYAHDAEAIGSEEVEALWQRGWAALGEAAAEQTQQQRGSEPTHRYLELLGTAIASGEAHIATINGGEPEDTPEAWGWRHKIIGTGDNEREEWQAQGQRIGWLDGADLYLEPQAAHAAAQRLGHQVADPLTVLLRTLHKRLAERGLLASGGGRRGNTIRKTVEGARREVLHLAASLLVGKTAQTDQSTADEPPSQEAPSLAGQFSWSVNGTQGPETDQRTDHETAQAAPSVPGQTPDSEPLGSLGSSSRMERDTADNVSSAQRCVACPHRAIGNWHDGTPYCDKHRPSRGEGR